MNLFENLINLYESKDLIDKNTLLQSDEFVSWAIWRLDHTDFNDKLRDNDFVNDYDDEFNEYVYNLEKIIRYRLTETQLNDIYKYLIKYGYMTPIDSKNVDEATSSIGSGAYTTGAIDIPPQKIKLNKKINTINESSDIKYDVSKLSNEECVITDYDREALLKIGKDVENGFNKLIANRFILGELYPKYLYNTDDDEYEVDIEGFVADKIEPKGYYFYEGIVDNKYIPYIETAIENISDGSTGDTAKSYYQAYQYVLDTINYYLYKIDKERKENYSLGESVQMDAYKYIMNKIENSNIDSDFKNELNSVIFTYGNVNWKKVASMLQID